VERTFPVHSPSISRLEVASRGTVRRAKLYYLRDLRGKKARIKERRIDEAKLALMEAVAAASAASVEAADADEAGDADVPIEVDAPIEAGSEAVEPDESPGPAADAEVVGVDEPAAEAEERAEG
jgi:hypothetical protein